MSEALKVLDADPYEVSGDPWYEVVL